jgi:arginine N-succinyltransferase
VTLRLRPATGADLGALLDLARHLDTLNLPVEETYLAARLERSERSFADPGRPDAEREYQFALEDAEGRVVGTSAILSKHGTPGLPHTYLRVEREERVSHAAGIRKEHVTFRLGACEDGPSELAALILHPDVRGRPGWPGKLLSWGRYAYIARHPGAFEDRLIAEMRASFDAEGRSAFWESFGRHFTGMSYQEADRRSATRKQFILDLFPETRFYATLLEPEVAAQLGKVHPETLPAVRLLEQAGFHWTGEIDPFDAGPFFGAATRDVIPIRETLRDVIAEEGSDEGAPPWIASVEDAAGFRAVATRAALEADCARLPKEALDKLDISEGVSVALTPLPASARSRG